MYKKADITKKCKRLIGANDFIYIDGDHSFEFAYKDICNYFNYLSEDFVFGGHDIDQNGVSKAFIKFTQNRNLKNIYFKDPDWIVICVEFLAQ